MILARNQRILPFRKPNETDEEWDERFKDVNEQEARDYQHIDFSNPNSFGKFEREVFCRDMVEAKS